MVLVLNLILCRINSQTGSEDADPVELDDELAADQERHVRHPPIPVPNNNSPFDEEGELSFIQCLHDVRALELVPEHYGLTEDEWEEGVYGEEEHISRGRNSRQMGVELPFQIWWPRAVAWAQGLELMGQLLVELEYMQ